MVIKLKVDENNLRKMVNGEEFHANFNSNDSLCPTEIYVYPEDVKEVTKRYIVVKEKRLSL